MFVGTVQVFNALHLFGAFDIRFELWRQLALFLDDADDFFLALVQVRSVLVALFDLADFYLIKRARNFLPVACDERDGIALFQ